MFDFVGDSPPYDASLCDDNALYEGPPMTSIYVDSELPHNDIGVLLFVVWFDYVT